MEPQAVQVMRACAEHQLFTVVSVESKPGPASHICLAAVPKVGQPQASCLCSGVMLGGGAKAMPGWH